MLTKTAWLVLGAFLVGGVAGGIAVYEGDLTPSAPSTRPPSSGGQGGVVIRVENVGTHELNATMEVSRVSGGTVWSAVLIVPPNGDREHALDEGLTGKFVAKGRFTWAQPPRRGTGDFLIPYDTDECGAQTPYVVFRIDSTNGISFPEGEIKECR